MTGPTDHNNVTANEPSLRKFGANTDANDRASALAITGLTASLYIGSQILARESGGAPSAVELLIGFIAAVFLVVAVVAYVGPPNSWFATMHAAVRPARRQLLVVVSMVFAMVPRLEVGGFRVLGLGLRMTVATLTVIVVGETSSRWLLGASLLTIVLHRWTHPSSITLTFIGLILLGFALCTRVELMRSTLRVVSLTDSAFVNSSRAETSQGETSQVSRKWKEPRVSKRTAGSGYQTSERNLLNSVGLRATAGGRSAVFTLVAIALALAASIAFSERARQLAWNPKSSSRFADGQSSVGNGDTPRERFGALSAQDQLDLSYKPTLSNQEVMTLYTDAPPPVFLRAQTFDRWTGTTWKNGRIVAFERPTQTGMWSSRPQYENEVADFVAGDSSQPNSIAEIVPSTQRMVIRAQVSFSGYTPVPIEPIAMIWDDGPFVRWRHDGTATPTDGQGPSVYVVLHVNSSASDIDSSRTDLLVQTSVTAKVSKLAREITKNEVSLDGKASAISRWMSKNIRYDLSVAKPPRTVDTLEYILFQTKAGSCTHFASATAALLRSAGVPARIATGFVGQTQRLAGQIQVLAKDAHAWAEVPQVNGGWRVFDTTLGAQEVPPSSKKTAKYLWMLTIGALAIFICMLLIGTIVKRRRLTAAQKLWRDIVRIGQSAQIPLALPTAYRSYAGVLDDQLGLHGRLRKLGSELDQATFGPISTDPTSEFLRTDTNPFGSGAVLAEAKQKAKTFRRQRKREFRQSRKASRSNGKRVA
jgi:transglutaminase-like putative cysteine protease